MTTFLTVSGILLSIYLIGLVFVYTMSIFLAKKFNFGIGLFGDQNLVYRSKKIESRVIIVDSLLWPLIIGLMGIVLFIEGVEFLIKLVRLDKIKLFKHIKIIFSYIMNYFIKKTDNILKG